MHIDWDDFRFLLALAKSGTLSAAAKDLKVEHTTVSRRLKRFEATLGRPLFVVDRTGYRLTAFGEEVARRAALMDDHARSLPDAPKAGERFVGPIRLTTARTLASGYLLPRLLEFAKTHVEIELTVLADARVLSLARREADIAVRRRPEDSDLVGSHVADIEYAYFCSSDLAERALAGEPLAFVDYEAGNGGSEAGGSPSATPGRASRCAATTSGCKPTPFAAALALACCQSTSRATLSACRGVRRLRVGKSG
jgi:DNA-binding transcriptional LysR family regulator